MVAIETYEVVQKHEYQDTYRLCHGVLLIVNKYTDIGCNWYWVTTDKHKKEIKKIKGIKNCYELTNSVFVYGYSERKDIELPVGTIILDHSVIKPVKNINEFIYELKTTGSCFCGNKKEFTMLTNMINEIMSSYKEENNGICEQES